MRKQNCKWQQKACKGILLILISLVLLSNDSVAQIGTDQETARLETNARVDWGYVSAPMRKFLLIRKENDICAVRFTEFHRDHDNKPSTIFISGDETLHAEYDWYCQRDGSHDLTKSNVNGGHKKLVRKPLIGLFRLAFQTGDIEVNCSPFKLHWLYPSFVYFYGGSAQGDVGIEIAPTRWTDIKEVNARDSKLKWYRYDEHRKSTYVPLDDL